MSKNLPIVKELIEKFIREEYPEQGYKIGEGYWYVECSRKIGWNIHYEYNHGRVHMDIEGGPGEWKAPRNFFRERIKDSRVFSTRQYRLDCRWTLDKTPKNWEEVKECFRELHYIMKPHILAWEKQIDKTSKPAENEPDGRSVRTRFETLRNIIQKRLFIPNYQRPYEWTERNVEQLLSDINAARLNGKTEYLIGSLILHCDTENRGELAIVDGQQRLTTILLVLRALKYMGKAPELTYNNSDSFYHIKTNYEYIRNWIYQNLSEYERLNFVGYVLDSCRLVEIIVSELSEAFQLFETQNGRGKELEAYNLLKAFHLRAMRENSQTEKIESDVRWENAAMFVDKNDERIDLLRQIIDEHLFRIRIWSKGEEAGRFSKNRVDEFKGYTIWNDSNLDYPYQNIMLQQQIAVGFLKAMNQSLFKVKNRFIHGDPENMSPFVSINQLIINGKPFFDYIETYIEIYKRLFVNSSTSQLAGFKKFYNRYCEQYGGWRRTGDGYIRQVYKSAILLVFDRFGETGINELYSDLYAILYYLRLTRQQIKYATMTKRAESGWLFSSINNAKSIADLAEIRNTANDIRLKLKNGKVKPTFPVEEIQHAITDEFHV